MEFPSWVSTNDLLHERDEIRGSVSLTQLVRHLAGRDLEGGEQVDHTVPLVVVRVARCTAFAQRQRKLRSLECLDRRLLVDAEHDRMFGWVEIKPDDVLDLLDDFGSRLTL